MKTCPILLLITLAHMINAKANPPLDELRDRELVLLQNEAASAKTQIPQEAKALAHYIHEMLNTIAIPNGQITEEEAAQLNPEAVTSAVEQILATGTKKSVLTAMNQFMETHLGRQVFHAREKLRMPHNKKDAIQNAIASGIDEISAERQALLDTLQGLYADAELVASITMLPSRAITAGNIAGTAAGLANTPLAAEQSGYPEEKTKQAKEKIDAAEAATEKNFAIYFRRIWQSATAEISDENLQNWIAFLKTASGKEYLATKKEVMETVFLDKANVVTEMITQRVKTKLREHIEERSAAYRQHLETKKEPSQDSPQASNP